MKKLLIVSLLLMVVLTGAYAAAAQEAASGAAADRWLPGDPASDDIIRQKGLPRLDGGQMDLDVMTVWVSGISADVEKEWLEQGVTRDYPGIEVSLERLGTNPLKEAATVRVIAGNPPSLAHVSGGYAIDEFIRQGVLQDVTRYWDYYDLESVVSPALASGFKFDGKYYGFPHSDAPQALLYWNRRVFEEAGVPQPPYETWDDFFAAAELWKQARPGVPFYTYGLNPGWYSLERAFVQAATMFGSDFIFRIFNGNASLQDFSNMLNFNRQLIAISNSDFASIDSIQGLHDVVIRGEAALCYSGSWGLAAFKRSGILEGADLGYSLLPGHPMHFTTISGFVVFARSGREAAAEAVGVHSMLKDVQTVMNVSKDNIPARTDIVMDPADGWSQLVMYIYDQLAGAEVIPRANTGFPSALLSEIAPIFTAAMIGDIPIDRAARNMKDIQDRNQESYQFIRWGQ